MPTCGRVKLQEEVALEFSEDRQWWKSRLHLHLQKASRFEGAVFVFSSSKFNLSSFGACKTGRGVIGIGCCQHASPRRHVRRCLWSATRTALHASTINLRCELVMKRLERETEEGRKEWKLGFLVWRLKGGTFYSEETDRPSGRVQMCVAHM